MESLLARTESRRPLRSFAASFLPNRFDWLMGLYGENHQRLARLFAPHRLVEGEYRSSVGDGLDVCLSVQQDRDLAASVHSVLPLPAPVIIDEDSDEKLLKTDDPLDLSAFTEESEEDALARAIAEEQETDA